MGHLILDGKCITSINVQRLHFVSKSCDFALGDINASCEIRLHALTFKRGLKKGTKQRERRRWDPAAVVRPAMWGPFIGVSSDQWKNRAAAVCTHTRWPQSVQSHLAASAQHLLLPALMTNSIYSTFWLRYRSDIPFTVPLSSILKWLKTAPIFSPYQCEPVLF